MTLSYTSAPGNLYNRLGKVGALIANADSHQTTQEAAMINTTTGVVAQFNAEPDIQALMSDAYIGLLNNIGNVGSTAQTIARATINRMIFRDNPQSGQDLTSQNVLASIREVIRQMRAVGASVLAQTITATPAAFLGTGNGAVVTSVRRPLDGLVLENAFAETLLLTCTADSYTGGATAGNESFSLLGTGAQANVFAFDWPLGSGASTSLSAINGGADNTNGNLLTNSGFETFSSNVPSNWTAVVGVGGTMFFEESTLVYDPTSSGKALRIQGDGATLGNLRQTFDSASGTAGTLSPLTQYSHNLWLRRDGTAPAAGVLAVELVDSGGNVINDANGSANRYTIALTGLSTNYTAYNGVFRTPTIMPSAYSIQYRMTTGNALTNGRSVYLDRGSLGLMTQAYVGGPYLACHSGNTRFVLNDFATIAVTNSRGSGGTLATWQTLAFRLFTEMAANELLLPSSAAPTVADALIS